MEAMGEWSNNLGGMYTYATEETDFMNQLLASYDHPGTGSSSGTAGGDQQGLYWSLGSNHNHLSLMPEASSFGFSGESSSYSVADSRYYTVVPPTVEETNNGSLGFGMEDATVNTNSYLVGEETSECDVEKYSSGKTLLPLETVVENHDDGESMLQSETTTDYHRSLAGSKKRSRATSTDVSFTDLRLLTSCKSRGLKLLEFIYLTCIKMLPFTFKKKNSIKEISHKIIGYIYDSDMVYRLILYKRFVMDSEKQEIKSG